MSRRLPPWVTDPRTTHRLELALVTLVLAGGIWPRLQLLLANRSLWSDEAGIALNVIERDVPTLLAPLAYGQAAPFGWLLLVKLTVAVFGSAETLFRLVPFAAGVGALILQYVVTRRLLGVPTALLATALVAVAARAVYYAQELKPYSTDQLLAIGLLGLLAGLHRGPLGRRRVALLAGVGVLAPWFSFPSLFVLGGLAGVGLVLALVGRDWRRAATIAGLGAFWLAAFGLAYLFVLRGKGEEPGMLAYWQTEFAPFPLTSAADLEWYRHWIANDLFNGWVSRFTPDSFTAPIKVDHEAAVSPLLFVAFALGLALLAWRRPSVLAYVLAPIVVALAASAVKRYPVGDRLILYFVPLLAIVLAAGVVEVARRLRWVGPPVGAALGLGLLASLTPPTLDELAAPYWREETRATFNYLAEHWQPNDAVYIFGDWAAHHGYYADQADIPEAARAGWWIPSHPDQRQPWMQGATRDPNARANGPGRTIDASALAPFQRVWVIVPEGATRRDLATLDAIGPQLDKFSLRPAGLESDQLYLYALPACHDACLAHERPPDLTPSEILELVHDPSIQVPRTSP